jgi:hypothetical protein
MSSIGVGRITGAIALQRDIQKALGKNSRWSDGKPTRVHRRELDAELKAEGYRSGNVIADTTRAVHRFARRKDGGRIDPSFQAVDKALDVMQLIILRRAASDSRPGELSDAEYRVLPKDAKTLVRFARKYGNATIDELFF